MRMALAAAPAEVSVCWNSGTLEATSKILKSASTLGCFAWQEVVCVRKMVPIEGPGRVVTCSSFANRSFSRSFEVPSSRTGCQDAKERDNTKWKRT